MARWRINYLDGSSEIVIANTVDSMSDGTRLYDSRDELVAYVHKSNLKSIVNEDNASK